MMQWPNPKKLCMLGDNTAKFCFAHSKPVIRTSFMSEYNILGFEQVISMSKIACVSYFNRKM